jgi:hypothetical protein
LSFFLFFVAARTSATPHEADDNNRIQENNDLNTSEDNFGRVQMLKRGCDFFFFRFVSCCLVVVVFRLLLSRAALTPRMKTT